MYLEYLHHEWTWNFCGKNTPYIPAKDSPHTGDKMPSDACTSYSLHDTWCGSSASKKLIHIISSEYLKELCETFRWCFSSGYSDWTWNKKNQSPTEDIRQHPIWKGNVLGQKKPKPDFSSKYGRIITWSIVFSIRTPHGSNWEIVSCLTNTFDMVTFIYSFLN